MMYSRFFMTIIINKDEFSNKKKIMLKQLTNSVFIYPTDTIYGIGCSALDEGLVQRVRDIKKRFSMPFSIIAPSKEWIRETCELTPEAEKWIKKLPGPFTLILKLKNPDLLPEQVNQGLETIGVRIPDNWFSKIVEELGVPIITTSANLTGGNYMVSLDDLHPKIKNQVDFIVYEGVLKGKPSTLIRLDQGLEQIEKR